MLTRTPSASPNTSRSTSAPSISGPIEAPALTSAVAGPASTISSPLSRTVILEAVDVVAAAVDAFDDNTVADTIFDCANRLPGGGDDPIGPRLEFLVTQVSGLAGFASGKSRLQLGGFFLEVNAHQPGRGKGHKQQRQDVTKNVGDGITRRDIGLLLAQDIVGKTELCQRARRRSDHG